MANIRPVDANGELIPEKLDKVDQALNAVKEPQGIEGTEILNDALIKSVEQSVGLDLGEEITRYSSQVKTILEWAKTQTKEHTPENIKWAIRQLEMRIGTPPIGEKIVSRLARIAFLEMENKKINEEIKSYTIS
jgi:hypothetical protein